MIIENKEFHKVDMETGERLDVLLLVTKYTDDGNNVIEAEIPEDCKEGWGERIFHSPVWDFELNDWKEGLSLTELIEPVRQRKVMELSDECNANIEAGFIFEGNEYQFNMKDQSNFNQQLSLILLDETLTSLYWKTENNGIQLLTREQFINTCKAGEFHKRTNIGHYWELKEYIQTQPFSSVEEIEAIDFGFMIPVEPDTEPNTEPDTGTGTEPSTETGV